MRKRETFAGALVVVFLAATAVAGVWPKCWFHELTGLYCPGCGGTRAVMALLRGDLALAVRQNALILVVTPLVAMVVGRWIKSLWSGEAMSWHLGGTKGVLLALVFLAFAAARNLPLPALEVLRPIAP